jgi:hypothetical protein
MKSLSPLLLPLLLSAAACTLDHAPGLQEVGRDDCYSCHQADYEGAANPVHVGQKPTTCGDCHLTTGWRPAIGGGHPESLFPINGGPHGGIACLSCHNLDLGPVSTENVDCIGCHTHNQAEMADKHHEVGGYSWQPSDHDFCRTCHPNGRGGD